MRSVTVEVPDDAAEAVIRNSAEHLCAGREIICLPRPQGIPDEWVPTLVSRMVAMLKVAAGELEAIPAQEV